MRVQYSKVLYIFGHAAPRSGSADGDGGYRSASAARVMPSTAEKIKKAPEKEPEKLFFINYCGIMFFRIFSLLNVRIYGHKEKLYE